MAWPVHDINLMHFLQNNKNKLVNGLLDFQFVSYSFEDKREHSMASEHTSLAFYKFVIMRTLKCFLPSISCHCFYKTHTPAHHINRIQVLSVYFDVRIIWRNRWTWFDVESLFVYNLIVTQDWRQKCIGNFWSRGSRSNRVKILEMNSSERYGETDTLSTFAIRKTSMSCRG